MKQYFFFVILAFCVYRSYAQTDDYIQVQEKIKLLAGRVATYELFIKTHENFAKHHTPQDPCFIRHLFKAHEWTMAREAAKREIEELETRPLPLPADHRSSSPAQE